MRILIVDDEPVSREVLHKKLYDIAECEMVDSGSAAITAFREAWENWSPFDIITLDISMPNMDGKEVLQKIRGIEEEKNVPEGKKVKILMATAHADKDTILTCVEMGCDDYITKPFESKIIIKKLSKLGFDVSTREGKEDEEEDEEKEEVRRTILKIIHKLNEGEIELPVLPNVINDIQKVMNEPTSNVNDLAQIIERDAVISVRLIFVANSPFYRGTDEIRKVSKAISRVGYKETQSIVSAIANKSLYATKNEQFRKFMEELWLHSLACAYGSKIIANKLAFGDEEKIFLKGLIHDIGKVVLFKTFSESASKERLKNLDNVEIIIQKFHTSFGGAFLKRLRFTEDFVKIALLHEDSAFQETTDKEILIVNLANNLSRKIGYSLHSEEVELSDLQSAKLLKINDDELDDIGEEVKKMMLESGVFF